MSAQLFEGIPKLFYKLKVHICDLSSESKSPPSPVQHFCNVPVSFPPISNKLNSLKSTDGEWYLWSHYSYKYNICLCI